MWIDKYIYLLTVGYGQFLSNIKNMKSERFNNFLLKINRKFVWHTAYHYRINYIIYGFSDYFSHYINNNTYQYICQQFFKLFQS